MEGETFVQRLLTRLPILDDVLQAHLTENEHLLPHVFFGDVSRFTLEQHARLTSGDASARSILATLFEVMEQGAAEGSEYVKELVSVSFLENLARELAQHPSLSAFLTPALKQELEPILRAYGYSPPTLDWGV